MKNILKIYVHTGNYNSFCGADFSGYKELESKKESELFIKENKFEINEVVEEKDLDLRIYFLKSLTHNRRLEEIKSLFIKGKSKDVDAYFDLKEKKENELKKQQGFIRCKKYDDMTSDDYKGNLNHALTDGVIKYISSGIVYGYLGHCFRQLEHDKIIEQVFSKVTMTVDGENKNVWQSLGTWLTSSGARHWMDSREEDTFEEFKDNLEKSIKHILTDGFIYGLDEHNGTYGSTIELQNRYEDSVEIVYNK